MSFGTNPFRDPKPWNRVKLGGLEIVPVLTAIDGVKIEDEWAVDKPSGGNGASSKFKGTKPVQGLKLTFKAWDEKSFDALRDIYELLTPVPTPGFGAAAAKVSDPKAKTKAQIQGEIDSTKAAATAAEAKVAIAKQNPGDANAAAEANAAVVAVKAQAAVTNKSIAEGASDGEANKASGFPADPNKKSEPNPGPKPPTVTIENACVNYIGVLAVARKSWEGPKHNTDNSWDVIIEFVAVKPPTPAGTGTAGAAKVDAAAPGIGNKGGEPAGKALDANKAVGQGGAWQGVGQSA